MVAFADKMNQLDTGDIGNEGDGVRVYDNGRPDQVETFSDVYVSFSVYLFFYVRAATRYGGIYWCFF